MKIIPLENKTIVFCMLPYPEYLDIPQGVIILPYKRLPFLLPANKGNRFYLHSHKIILSLTS